MNIKLQTRLKLIEILIKEQWDDIQRVLSSLVIGKTTQSISPIAWTNINMNDADKFDSELYLGIPKTISVA